MGNTSVLKFFIVSCFFGVLTFMGCGGDEPNPCKDLKPVTAQFKIFEAQQGEFPESYEPLDTDTVATNFVFFEAVETDASYEWTIGAEVITTRSFRRHSFPRGQNLEVSLKVIKAPNSKCFPDDDGEDLVTRKFFTTVGYECDSNVNGTFEGHNEDEPSETRTITIETCVANPSVPEVKDLRINNLLEGCKALGFLGFIGGYKQIYFSGNTECLNPHGTATLSPTDGDSIRIIYTLWKGPNDFDTVNKIFIGARK